MPTRRLINALSIHVGCGILACSLWSLSTMSSNVMRFARHASSANLAPSQNTDCALLFFGLPRSYETLALSSIVEHILKPNKEHRCDVYVHAPLLEREAPGRSGKGGPIDGNAIYLLQDRIHELYNNSSAELPQVHIHTETEQHFWNARGGTIETYRTTIDNSTGKLLYFPWARSRTYKFPTTMDNMVRQWHSIQAVWKLMEESCNHFNGKNKYKRMGMFRSDVFYATPIDIYNSTKVVLPGFAMYPVNDRMIVGDHDSVKIWATERFSRIDNYVRNKVAETGIGMQSETFISNEILPAIVNQTNATIQHDPGICFWRVRADQSVWISDCEKKRIKGSPPLAKYVPKNKTQFIEEMTGMSCQASRLNRGVTHAICRTVGEVVA